MSFAGSTASIGVISYSSLIDLEAGTDLGNSDLMYGAVAKHGGHIAVINNGVTGTVTDTVFEASGGGKIHIAENDATAPRIAGLWNQKGVIYDHSTDKRYWGTKQQYGETRYRSIGNGQTVTEGGGTVNELIDRIELREPGNSAAKEAAQWVKHVGVSLQEPHIVRWYLENIAVDNNVEARMVFAFGDDYNIAAINSGMTDGIILDVLGNGALEITHVDGGTTNATANSVADNTYVNNLNWVEAQWTGKKTIFRAYDGSTEYSISLSTDYPSAPIAHDMFVKALDREPTAAFNVDFDVVGIEWR